MPSKSVRLQCPALIPFVHDDGNWSWKDIYKHGTPQFIKGGMTRHDVLQTELGDCWFMAAAASLTFHPQLLERVVPPDQYFEEGEYAGIFHFRFWQYGQWVDVVVDDLLPVWDGKLRFARHNDDFWMALLEKAYAKLNGSYEAIEYGHLNEAFVDLTGGIGEITYTKDNKNLFETIEMALERKSLLGAGISETVPKDAKGLEGKHAYSIIDTHKLNIEGKKVRLVKLRNPWGKIEWTGNWSDSSEMWSKIDSELRKTLVEKKEDGEFWMELGDFKLHFQQLDICHLSFDTLKQKGDHYSWKPTTYHGHWIKGVSYGHHLWDNNNIWNNPQYLVSLRKLNEAEWDPKEKKSTCSLIVSLMQKNWRKGKAQGKKQLRLELHIYEVLNEVTKESLQMLTTTQIKQLVYPNPVGIMSGPLRDVTGSFQLRPGNYVIIPFTSPHDEAEFILRIFTETKHECLELNDEISADEKTLKVEPPPQTGVNRMMDITFQQYARQDKKIGTAEFKKFMDNTYISGQELQKSGFSMEDCQKIIQHFDESGTGRLTRDAFKQCVTKINEWVRIFKEYDADVSGTMDAYEICGALEAAGFHLNYETIKVLLEKFSNPFYQISFDKFVTCLVLLESVFRKVKSWLISNLPEEKWLDLIKSS